jgi:hypothetical protein
MRFLIAIGCFALGYLIIRFSKWLVDSTGIVFGSAESFFGGGGTMTVVKVLGLAIIAFGFWYLFH